MSDALAELRNRLTAVVSMTQSCPDVPRNPDSLPMMVLHEVKQALQSLPAIEQAMQGWQPIETAPKDKTMVALLHVGANGYRRYGVGWHMPLTGWQGWPHEPGEDYAAPTHWMPLPTPPTEGA